MLVLNCENQLVSGKEKEEKLMLSVSECKEKVSCLLLLKLMLSTSECREKVFSFYY